MIHVYDGHGLRFAVWTGPGRDPQVAYLDGHTFAIATSELGSRAWLLHAQGLSQNTLGGARRGAIDPAAVHRMSHCVLDASGSPVFELEPPCQGAIGSDGLCDTARQDPGPVTPARPVGNLVVADGFALQWIAWDDPPRAGRLRRAVSMDERFLLEAALAADGHVRAWPARGLMAQGLELVTPSGRELTVIEDRIMRETGSAR